MPVRKAEILRDELDIEQPAGGELDVPRVALALFLGDERAHVSRRLGELFRVALLIEARRDDRPRLFGERRVAGDRPGARQSHMLPDFRLPRLIIAKPGDLRRNRPLIAGGAQPHIHFVKLSPPRRRRQCSDQPLRQAGVIDDRVQGSCPVRFGILLVEIVKQDEVEIGSRGHFARAEFAQRQNHAAPAGDPSVFGDKKLFDLGETGADHDGGKGRIGPPPLFRLDQPGEKPQADHKPFFRRENPRCVEKDFEILRRADEEREVFGKILFLHRRRGEAAVDRRVEQMGRLGDCLGKARRAAEHVGEELAHVRIRLEQGKKLDRRRHFAERDVKRGERGIGIAGFGKGVEQGRHDFGQHFAGACAAHRRAAAEMPAAHRLGGERRIAKAQFAQGLDRIGIVARADEDQTAGAGIEARRMFEKARVMALHRAQMAQQSGGKTGSAAKAAKAGEILKSGLVGRQALRLMVMQHLQAMLDAAQKTIGLAQFPGRFRRDPAVDPQLTQHVERARAA